MKKYKRKTLVDMYRGIGKYWDTSDKDYLDTVFKLARDIDYSLWCEIESLACFAVRKHKSIATLIEAMRLLGYEVEDESTE